MADFYLKSGAGAAEFAQSTAYSLGDKMVPKRSDTAGSYLIGRRWVWECTTAGTSAAAEPTWVASVTQDVTTITSGTATFTARKPGFSSGSTADWTFATIYLQYLTTAVATGDTIYVSDAHSESYAEAISFAAQANVICVDDAATPPTTRATGAVIATAGEFAITLTNVARGYFYGIHFKCAVGATGTRSITTGGSLESCTLELASTGASSVITGLSSRLWKDVQVKFAAAGQMVTGLPKMWSGGGLASGGTSPTNFIGANASGYGFVENLDLTNANSAINLTNNASAFTSMFFRNIKMPASWSGVWNGAASPLTTTLMEFYNVGDGLDAGFYSKNLTGEITTETTIVKTGGGATSFKMATDTDAFFPESAIVTPEISAYNSTSGSAITVTVDVISDSLTNLTDKDVVLDVSYVSAADSMLGDEASSMPSFMATATDLTASSATWTTTGMSNPNTQKVSVTFTPQQAGFIHATVKLCKASATVYVDPVLQIS